MPRALSFFLIFLSLVVGILLGNQYGRRDVINGQPPQVTGPTGQPGAVNVDYSGIELLNFPIYASGTINVYGALSVASLASGSQAIAYIWQKPSGDVQRVKAVIFSTDHQPLLVLTEFLSTDWAVRMNLPKLESGQYVGFIFESESQPSLVSAGIN